jgi:hypothetical protein
MTNCPWRAAVGIAATVGLVSFGSNLAVAQAQDGNDTISDNDSIFVDAKTFKVVPGRAKGDAFRQIENLGARDIGPGALIFRSGDQLYIVDSPLLVPNSRPADRKMLEGETRPNRIVIEYVPPKNPEHQKLYEMLQERRALEKLQFIFSPLLLPVDVTIRSAGCDGVPNAWYQREGSRPLVTLCYEYLQEIMDRMPKETTPEGFTPHDTVIGQFFYAAMHEMGHAVFDIFDVPVFGREEDAADQFATYMLLQFGEDQARRLIGGAAYAYKQFIKDPQEKTEVVIPVAAFSSNHGTPEERFYNLLCIAYGADPVLFGDVVEHGYLPATRAASCKYEFHMLCYAFRHEVGPHVDQRMAREVMDAKWLTIPTSRPLPGAKSAISLNR